MAILGLISTESFSNERYKSARRKVFYDYPNGSFPLTGITSMIEEETCSDPEFNWWEKRMKTQRTTTAAVSGGNGPFAGSGATANNTWGTTLRTGGAGIDAGGAPTAGDKISLKVATGGTAEFRVGHIIHIQNAVLADGTTKVRLVLRVGQIDASNHFLDCTFVSVPATGLDNNGVTGNNGLGVLAAGSAYAQGAAGSSVSPYTLPVNPKGYCQIFRTEFSFTGTAAKTSAKFDSTGIYKDRSKEASIDHMVEIERGLIFGVPSKVLDASSIPTYTTGGILWHMEQWEKGSDADATHGAVLRTGSAVTANSDSEKRIIDLGTGGKISDKDFDNYLERCFRVTNNKSNEKLALCGSGFLSVINQLYKSKGTLNASIPMTETYGMDVVGHRTPFGSIYYKTHPLFSMNPDLQYACLILDVGNLVYRYLPGRDTDILANRQANNVDGRTDEWLTECGLEVRYPEANMMFMNVTDYAI